MPQIAAQQTLAQIVNTDPTRARTLERFGLDYCCGGRRRLDEACASLGIDPALVVRDLGLVEPSDDADWTTMGPGALVDHLESTHHAYLRAEFGRVVALADKVAEVHAARHPELGAIRSTVLELRAELEPHLATEESVLFPMIRELAGARSRPSFACGSIRNPISAMMAEHDRAGDLLGRLRVLTGGYVPPADGCASYRALFGALADLEFDTHLHVHKENNLLFPAVVALEETLKSSTP